jgi:hypothetical protein
MLRIQMHDLVSAGAFVCFGFGMMALHDVLVRLL